MLRRLARATQAVLLALVAYNLLTALAGWRDRRAAPPGSRKRRFRVVIPAHDEETVIRALLGDLAAQHHPAELVDVWVVADRCTDRTGDVARGAGAEVAARSEGPEGKGAALAWYLDRHPLRPDEALVVLDADNRVPPHLLSRFSDELEAGHQVLQAYLDVANPDASPLATASALSYWAGNRMVQLARTNLGWSADLGGTGMCFTATALAAAGGFGESLTEDQELGVRLALAGVPVVWLHDVRIRDEKPATVRATVGQRARWAAGKQTVVHRHLGRLVREAAERRSFALADQAIRLVQPGRSFVALVTCALAVLAGSTGSGWLLPARVWTAAAVAQVAAPIPFLARDRVPARYLVRYPLLVALGALWIPIRIVASRAGAAWYHTRHVGAGEQPGGGDGGRDGRES